MKYYLINTDREAIDAARKAKGLRTCDLWFAYRMAFAGNKKDEPGKHAKLFEKLKDRDVLFMYHSGVGCVGVGIVPHGWDGDWKTGEDRLLYTNEFYEYRIDVDWTHDWRASPRKEGLPVPHGRPWQEIDENRYPMVRDASRSAAEYEKAFEEQVAASLALSDEARSKAILETSSPPRSISRTTTVFERSPHVVAHVLRRAKGRCEQCGQPAPFARKSDGSPYLEVHHIQTLAVGGLDTVANARAVCPNCHREAHYG